MQGAELNMDYDQERTYLKTHCLEYDLPNIFGLLSKTAQHPDYSVLEHAKKINQMEHE